MLEGENATVIEYVVPPVGNFEVRPLIAFRDYHATSHVNYSLDPKVHIAPGLASVTPYQGMPTLFLSHNGACEPCGSWYYNFEYSAEQERGLDFSEDLFNPLVLRFPSGCTRAVVIASTEPHSVPPEGIDALRRTRPELPVSGIAAADPFVQQLVSAANQFIVRRGSLHTVIAGYHWFSDWGRDTMIALPGLTLATGRYDIAREILQAFAECIDQGMLPNCFSDAGETAEYNTVDATLWFFEAIRAYLQYSGDSQFVREKLYPRMKDIIDWHVRGTRYGIHADSDGLLACGEAGVQLTWMDAKVGDWVVTPRIGKPVEIQALWYNALCTMEDFARRFDDEAYASFPGSMAAMARESFAAQFWNPDAGCLYDVIDGDNRDGSIRPNQVFAISLHYRILPPERADQVLEVVQRELLTPLGLRTLSPADPQYRGRYEGGVYERDSAYHQGTVWPWLMGPFVTAWVKVAGRSAATRQQVELWLLPFREHLNAAGLGQISEIADGDAPHTPRGCIAQAWSVAELLRVTLEEVYGIPGPPKDVPGRGKTVQTTA